MVAARRRWAWVVWAGVGLGLAGCPRATPPAPPPGESDAGLAVPEVALTPLQSAWVHRLDSAAVDAALALASAPPLADAGAGSGPGPGLATRHIGSDPH